MGSDLQLTPQAAKTGVGNYIARQVRWEDDEPVARVVLRYTVTPEGTIQIGETL